MPKRLFWVLAFLLLIFSGPVFAQLSTKSDKAAQLYEKGLAQIKAKQYKEAINSLQLALKKDEQFGEAYLKLGNVYRSIGERKLAREMYKAGVTRMPFNAGFSSEYFYYAELALLNGEYDEAGKYYDLFFQANPTNKSLLKAAAQQREQVKFALEAVKKPIPFNPTRLSDQINQFRYHYFPTVTADEQYFLYTARSSDSDDEDIYICDKTKNGGWSAPRQVSEVVNSPDNEGAASISGDGKTLVYTACDRKDSYGSCDLYICYKVGTQWSPPQNMGQVVNSSTWDSQPSLSADGRTIYFASERGGGIGYSDIWMTTRGEDNNWIKPVNLGPNVNTADRESSPCLHASGTTIYFASDGHPGMGGTDLYKSTLEATGWSKPFNLGYPLNSPANESTLFIEAGNVNGYYSRDIGGKSERRIELFQFKVPELWRSKVNTIYSKGKVYDAQTKKPLAASVDLFDLATGKLASRVSSDPQTGEYVVVLNEGSQYAMYAKANKYLPHSFHFDFTAQADFNPQTLDIYLNPIKAGSSIVLRNLFFETKKYELEDKSKTELNQLISFLQENSAVRVEISGHTDDVGTNENNQVLSEKRAKAVQQYLVNKGIKLSRIVAKGYGEQKPKAANNSADNRAQNRRIEMRIL